MPDQRALFHTGAGEKFVLLPSFITSLILFNDVLLRKEWFSGFNSTHLWNSTESRSYGCTTRSLISLALARLAEHPREWRKYHSLRKEYYWPQMTNEFYTTLKDFRKCTSNKSAGMRPCSLKLFQPSDQLEFVEVDMQGPLPKTVNGNLFVLGMTDHYPRLTRAVLASRKTASHVASWSMDNCVNPYWFFTHLLIKNKTQFVSSAKHCAPF